MKRRTNAIRKTLKPSQIHHVSTKENPADCASRGITPEELAKHPLWFQGPEFLKTTLPTTPMAATATEEEVDVHIAEADQEDIRNSEFINRPSSLYRLKRTISICMRWKTKSQQPKLTKTISADELHEAEIKIIRIHQRAHFGTSIDRLAKQLHVPQNHWLSTLNPFLDRNQIMRVGGRLEHSSLPSDQAHPIILQKGHLVTLIIRHTHSKLRHAGVSQVVAHIRETYAIPALFQQTKKHIRRCVTCNKDKARTSRPIMGPLPAERIRPAHVFESTGTDLAGPFSIRSSHSRKAPTLKVYIAIFVCTVTKAIHIELCNDLSTNGYLNAFRRFTSRRGTPKVIRSDNATNLVGSNKFLKEAWRTICLEGGNDLAAEGITWLFNPPRSPHYGGLFEAAIGSFNDS